jgi:hypothetical protein
MPTTDADRKWAREQAAKAAARYGSGDRLHAMPWTRDQMRKEELEQWVGSRKEAGRAIDIATCEIARWYTLDLDPYLVNDDLPDEWRQIGKNEFVRSSESRGWVHCSDLPEEKYKALLLRIARENGWPSPIDDAAGNAEVPF